MKRKFSWIHSLNIFSISHFTWYCPFTAGNAFILALEDLALFALSWMIWGKQNWNIFPAEPQLRWKHYRCPPFFRLSLFVVDDLLANFHLLILQPPEPQWWMFPNQAGVPLLSGHCERQGLFPHLSCGGGGRGGSLGLRAVRPIILRSGVVPIDSSGQISVIESLGQLYEILLIKFSFTYLT